MNGKVPPLIPPVAHTTLGVKEGPNQSRKLRETPFRKLNHWVGAAERESEGVVCEEGLPALAYTARLNPKRFHSALTIHSLIFFQPGKRVVL